MSAALLGAYIITQLNFPLFYEPGTGVAQLEVMLRRWALLNYVRVCLGGAALVVLLGHSSAQREALEPQARETASNEQRAWVLLPPSANGIVIELVANLFLSSLSALLRSP